MGRTSLTESFALRDFALKWSLGRIAMLAVLTLCALGVIGWIAIPETPAAQHAAEAIKPYDPLQ